MLSDGRKYLLGGSSPTWVDLSFASLGGLIFTPSGYGGGILAFTIEDILQNSRPEYVEQVKEFQRRPSGQLALRLYREFRTKKALQR